MIGAELLPNLSSDILYKIWTSLAFPVSIKILERWPWCCKHTVPMASEQKQSVYCFREDQSRRYGDDSQHICNG